MKQQWKSQRWINSATAGLALMASASLGLAQTYPTNTFDNADSVLTFATWWGPTFPTFTWDATRDAGGNPNSGSVRYEAAFAGAADEQFMTYFSIVDSGVRLDASTYTNISFDIKVDPSSSQRKDNNDYGYLEFGLMQSGTGWEPIWVTGKSIPLSAATEWTHISAPILPSMLNLDKVTGLYLKLWSGGAFTNTLIFNVDNYNIAKPEGNVVIPPPTMKIVKAGPPGLEITMDNDTSQWQRDGISTPSGGGPYLWTAQGSYPVSYSMTISDFPAPKAHPGFEAHMYLVNGDTGGSQTSGSPDWGAQDIFIFRVDNTAAGAAFAQIQWKTNYPNANSTNVPVAVDAPSVVGTWTVTFTSATEGYLTGPGVTATNFTLPEDAVMNNFSPATSFLQYGIFKNDGANDGHNNQVRGTLSNVKFTGAAAPFEDDFSGPTLTTKYEWRKTSNSAVQHIPQGSAWLVDWTLPADGFRAESAPGVAGPWSNAGLTNTYTGGGKVHVLVPTSALPAGNAGLFRLVKRPFVKLQILLPGETAAPNTPTGKTGTPDAQSNGNPFTITVNAVDEFWNIAKSGDTVSFTSSDVSAFLPADAALVNGTATFTASFNAAGTFTITVTDVTDGTKTASTSSSVVVQ